MDRTLFTTPSDPARAAALALRDAAQARECWRLHGLARRLTDRRNLAAKASYLEEQVRRTADVLLSVPLPAPSVGKQAPKESMAQPWPAGAGAARALTSADSDGKVTP